ncbi:MAG TPA: helical backbone metal receptor [Acidimicrobiales bacterium]|nr:helical backbone metal receptor [Acidimicrobiales bacterium]
MTGAGPRVVSLVPSLTETLLAWRIEPIAVTRFCEQPRLEAVGGTKDPDLVRIVQLAPDLVLVNDEENRRQDHDALVAAGLDVHVVSITSVFDVSPQLAALRIRLGLDPLELVLPPPEPERLRAFVPIWRRPWMSLSASTYGSSLLAHIGIGNALADVPDRYPEVDLEDVVADIVLAPSEPYPFGERFRRELEVVAPVVFVDGQDLFWWGTRTPAAIERLKTATARL